MEGVCAAEASPSLLSLLQRKNNLVLKTMTLIIIREACGVPTLATLRRRCKDSLEQCSTLLELSVVFSVQI